MSDAFDENLMFLTKKDYGLLNLPYSIKQAALEIRLSPKKTQFLREKRISINGYFCRSFAAKVSFLLLI